MDPGARSAAAEVNITLNRLVRDGLILGYKTDVVAGAAPGETLQVTVFVRSAVNADSVRDTVQKALQPIPVTVTVRTGRRRTELSPRSPVQRQWFVAVSGCVLAGLMAVLVGTYLPGLVRALGLLR